MDSANRAQLRYHQVINYFHFTNIPLKDARSIWLLDTTYYYVQGRGELPFKQKILLAKTFSQILPSRREKVFRKSKYCQRRMLRL